MKELSQDLFYKNLTSFLSSLNIEWGVPELYKRIDFFLRDELSTEPLLVCSLSKSNSNQVIAQNDRPHLRRVYKTVESQKLLIPKVFLILLVS